MEEEASTFATTPQSTIADNHEFIDDFSSDEDEDEDESDNEDVFTFEALKNRRHNVTESMRLVRFSPGGHRPSFASATKMPDSPSLTNLLELGTEEENTEYGNFEEISPIDEYEIDRVSNSGKATKKPLSQFSSWKQRIESKVFQSKEQHVWRDNPESLNQQYDVPLNDTVPLLFDKVGPGGRLVPTPPTSYDNAHTPPKSNTKSNDNEEANYRERDKKNEVEVDRIVLIAATFLMDYENSRPVTLYHDSDYISSTNLWLHSLRFSLGWTMVQGISTAALFLASYFASKKNDVASGLLTASSVIFYALDMLMLAHLRKPTKRSRKPRRGNSSYGCDYFTSPRKSRSRLWTFPLTILFLALSIETSFLFYQEPKQLCWVGIFKPIALFYISPKARDALEALYRIAPVLVKVIFMELFLVLIFGAVACQLYGHFAFFKDLPTSFISMFQLSTTVVNPSLWMPVYNESPSSAIFFVLFLITSVFYFHSLVLSVVFQSYIQAKTKIRERYSSDREDASRLAFQTLYRHEKRCGRFENRNGECTNISIGLVQKVLVVLRPHYSDMKIDALLDMMNIRSTNNEIDSDSFRARIPKVLSTSLRSSRISDFTTVWKTGTIIWVMINMIFVIVICSPDVTPTWLEKFIFPLGTCLTGFSFVDLLVRFNRGTFFRFLPRKMRINLPFDSMALFAVAISSYGILLRNSKDENVSTSAVCAHFLVIGRAVDMLRFMRFFGVFRDIVTRTRQVLHALVGPLVLLMTALHVFCYLGMFLWQGKIKVGSTEGIEPLYDLNNFNSYASGLLTMFQVVVINDWHQFAIVHLTVSNPLVVYSFFILGNLICASILLNVLTAFFVGAFVTKTNDGNGSKRLSIFMKKDSRTNLDIYERPSFDTIMKTVAGSSGDDETEAMQACHTLEVFESLTSGRAEKVGYLVCCNQSMDRFGNHRFQNIVDGFIDHGIMHVVVSEMHTELTVSSMKGNDPTVNRVFAPFKNVHNTGDEMLELSASLLRKNPAMTLFVARVIGSEKD